MKSKSFLFLLPYILNTTCSFRSGGHADNDELSGFNRSQSESSTHSQHDIEPVTRKPKKLPLSSKKQQKTSLMQTKNSPKKPMKLDKTDYYDNSNNQPLNSNDQWDEPTDNRHQQYSNDNRRHQQLHSHDLSTQKSNRYNKQTSIKTRNTDRPQTGIFKISKFSFSYFFFSTSIIFIA
jgi:hypothetical protein